jgi:hypothetical protein
MSYRLEKQKAAFLASASFYNPRIAELDALVQRTTLKTVLPGKQVKAKR